MYGSVKNKIVASDLVEERKNRDFQLKDDKLFNHIDYYNDYKAFQDADKFLENDPILRNSHKFYEMSREE